MTLRKNLRHSWLITIILFLFGSFHNADIFVISVVLPQILEEFQIAYTVGGLIFTATFFMAVILYPLWGYLFDRYSRKTLISLSGIIWGLTTWLNAIPRTFSEFFLTRTLTGVDNTPPSGMNSLVSDYFPPKSRGKPLGLLSATAALGALIGTILGVIVGYATGWRILFYITGGAGILMALLVYLTVKDVPRGSSEPELADLNIEERRYNLREFLTLIKKKSLLFLSLQGFFGVFPWQVLQAWIFTYMVQERGFNEGLSMVIMLAWLLSMIIGNLIGGMLGDMLFKRNIRGRAILGAVDVFLSIPMLYFTIMWPLEDVFGFTVIGIMASFILPMAGPNVSAAVTDIAEPEVRSSADASLRIFEYGGSSAAPLISGYLADVYGLGFSILYVSFAAWATCGIIFLILAFVIAKDILDLRRNMAERAETFKALPSSE